MKILSIDPGYERLGIAVLEKKDGKEICLYSSCFQTKAKEEFHERLFQIGQEIGRVIDVFHPEALSIETLFFNTNQKTAMRVSEARGVIIYTAKEHGLEIFEFTPLQIKTAITGDGRADKKQIMLLLPKLIKLEKLPKFDDEYDAIAAGITFFAYGNGSKQISAT